MVSQTLARTLGPTRGECNTPIQISHKQNTREMSSIYMHSKSIKDDIR